MKIVIGGASSVGKSLVGYLSLGNNDIIVVDVDKTKLDEISKEYDIQPVLGSISHPDIQESIGMKNVDMLIAVTESDEINMIACQVAYTLFNVPKKIARVDSKYFLNPLWNTLYNEKSLPVDKVITPDIEIAKYILNLFENPGSLAVYPFFNEEMNIFSFKHTDTDVPFMKFSLKHINSKLEELSAQIVLIIRGNRRITPKEDEIYLQKNDIIYVSCYQNRNNDVMRLFGVDHNPYERVIIFGANGVSSYLASQIEKDDNIVSCNIVEDDIEKAQILAEKLNFASVISGEMMSDVILEEAGFNFADISIAITNKDKDNLLISLLASKNKNTQAISLVNSKDYNVLATNIRNNVIIDRSVITISSILRYLRKARINEAYSLGREMGEVWEIRLGEDSLNLGRKVDELNIPADSSIMLISRENDLIYDFTNIILEAQDKIIIYVSPSDTRQIESIFYL
ncbi:Trk system potassium transporter TrkA [bacterium]|nr:Trk system potassium transporter TrkA [bacterium]